MQAAVLLEKLTIFDEELELRQNVSNQYRENINNSQHIPNDYVSSHALFSIVLDSEDERNKKIEQLKENQIPTVVYYKYPIHLMKGFAYLGYQKGDFPISEQLSQTIVSLPMHPYLHQKEIDWVVKSITRND